MNKQCRIKILMIAGLIVLSRAALAQQADSATVYVSFRVDTSGSISQVKAYKINCYKCSREYKTTLKKEAEKIMKENPYWRPLREPARYIQPIRFKLEKE